jgi:hypothetical protein
MGEEMATMFRMSRTKPFRPQNLDVLPREFLSLVPKQLLHLGIDQHDLALTIHYDHAIRRRFQQRAEPLLGLLSLGNKAVRRGDSF